MQVIYFLIRAVKSIVAIPLRQLAQETNRDPMNVV